MSKNILIIGFGNMGKSHSRSFVDSKKNYCIHVFDLKSVIKIEKKHTNKIHFFSKLPKDKRYDLVIIATSSKIRFRLLMQLLNFNFVKKIILEKFVFHKISYYRKFDKYIDDHKFLKVGVNTWGNYLYKNLNIRKLAIMKKDIKVIVPNGTMLTNFIHYADFFVNNEDDIKIKLNIKKITRSKRRGYHEALGSIIINSGNKKLIISTRKKQKNHIILFKEKYKILVDQNQKFIVLYKNKIIQKINFPYAFKYSEKNYMNNNNKILNYKKISYISQVFLRELKKLKKKEIIIT